MSVFFKYSSCVKVSILKVVFLDFDGVLFDTVREAYAIAMITTGKCNSLGDVDFQSLHYSLFSKYRYLISPAWNYQYLLRALEDRSHNLKNNYLQMLQLASEDEYKEFETAFFQTRSRLRKQDYEAWLRLNIPFPFLSKISKYIHSDPDSWYIVTTKDRATVEKLLDLENIFIKKENIFDKDNYAAMKSKHGVLASIMKNHNISDGLFIDDSRKHLTDCQNLENLLLLQPDWGYNLPEDSTQTQGEVLEDLIKFLGVE